MVMSMDGQAAQGRRQEGDLVALMHASAAGDRQAFTTLYERTSAKLYGICLRLMGNESEAQEVLQDTYIRVWQKAERFDASKASPITWLAVLARNKSIDRLRQRTAPSEDLDAASELQDDGLSAFDIAEQQQDRSRLSNCLGELEERPRLAIQSAFLDGATYPELAAREGVPVGTMKSWIRRGLLRLRDCLDR
jgi:RNA polymerase sigma-70 factor (ECF subfamily)